MNLVRDICWNMLEKLRGIWQKLSRQKYLLKDVIWGIEIEMNASQFSDSKYTWFHTISVVILAGDTVRIFIVLCSSYILNLQCSIQRSSNIWILRYLRETWQVRISPPESFRAKSMLSSILPLTLSLSTNFHSYSREIQGLVAFRSKA